ncbi:hypothetical protein V5O48_014962, partial [Marasmius crinis-equi]
KHDTELEELLASHELEKASHSGIQSKLQEALDQTESRLCEAVDRFEKKEQENQQLQVVMNTLKQTLQNDIAELAGQLRSKTSELESALADRDQHVQTIRDVTTLSDQEITTLSAELDDAKEQIEQKTSELSRVQGELEKAISERDKQRSQDEKHDANFEELRISHEALKQMESRLNEAGDQFKRKEQELSAARHDLQLAVSDIRKLEAIINEYEQSRKGERADAEAHLAQMAQIENARDQQGLTIQGLQEKLSASAVVLRDAHAKIELMDQEEKAQREAYNAERLRERESHSRVVNTLELQINDLKENDKEVSRIRDELVCLQKTRNERDADLQAQYSGLVREYGALREVSTSALVGYEDVTQQLAQMKLGVPASEVSPGRNAEVMPQTSNSASTTSIDTTRDRATKVAKCFLVSEVLTKRD